MSRMHRTATLFLVFFLLSISSVLAQSDYELVQNFKNRYNDFKREITTANNVSRLKTLRENVSLFKADYIENKALLDQALYPDNFNSYFEKLDQSIMDALTRVQDKREIGTLKEEVTILQEEVADMVSENERLYARLAELKSRETRTQGTIDSLKSIIARLRANIRERDKLVTDIVNELFGKETNVTEMNADAKQRLYTRIETRDFLDNVKLLLTDNIRFVQSGEFSAPKLKALKDEQQAFTANWEVTGPKVADVYSSQANDAEELNEINVLLEDWERALDWEIWNEIFVEFRLYNIEVPIFSNGEEFTRNITMYINDQISRVGTEDEGAAMEAFVIFKDSVWNKEVSQLWMPILFEHEMYTPQDKMELDEKVEEWGDSIEGGFGLWLYLVLFLLFIAVVYVIYRIASGQSKPAAAAAKKNEKKSPPRKPADKEEDEGETKDTP